MKTLLASWLMACLVLLTSCARKSPYQQPIEAESPVQLNLWRANLEGALTTEEWRWFDVVVQEFKFQLMLEQKMSGSGAIDAAVRKRITGRKLIDVMREGLQAHLKRKTAERDELESAITINSKRKIRPDDTTMLQELAAHQMNLRQKLAELNDELPVIEAELTRLTTQASS